METIYISKQQVVAIVAAILSLSNKENLPTLIADAKKLVALAAKETE